MKSGRLRAAVLKYLFPHTVQSISDQVTYHSGVYPGMVRGGGISLLRHKVILNNLNLIEKNINTY